MIGTAAAIIGSAVLGAGATMLASNNAANAADRQGQLQADAAANAQAENKREFDIVNANNAPARQLGSSAMSALGAGFGLSGYGSAPRMTGGTEQGVNYAGGSGSKSYGGMVSDPASYAYTDSFPTPSGPTGPGIGHNGGPSMTGGAQIDGQDPAVWDAYLAANPDVAAWAASGHGDPSLGPDQTPEQAAAYQYRNTGQAEGRQLPAVSMTGSNLDGGYAAPAGYADPTALNGYDPGSRPAVAPTPAGYTPGALDVSLGAYQESPDYNFRLSEGNKALDHVASQMGGLMSGARLKAADRYNQDYSTTDYSNWRDFTAGRYDAANTLGNTLAQERIAQSNADRARSDGLYADDRAYDASRYDTRNSQLLSMAGFGQAATNATNNAGMTYAQQQGALGMTAANAQGAAGINSANAFTSGVNNLLTTGAYLGGRYMTGNTPQSYYDVNPVQPSWAAGETDMAGLY